MATICSFVCTHSKRDAILKGFLHHYRRTAFPTKLFVFSNTKEDMLQPGEEQVADQYGRVDAMENNFSEWGSRLFGAIVHLLGQGFDYGIFHPDDGWILNDDDFSNRLVSAWNATHDYRLDNMRLSESILDRYAYLLLDQNVALLENKWSHHFLTHQTSIWNLRSLLRVLERTDTSSIHEFVGSQRVINLNYRMGQFTGAPILDSYGIHSMSGYVEELSARSSRLGFSPIKLPHRPTDARSASPSELARVLIESLHKETQSARR